MDLSKFDAIGAGIGWVELEEPLEEYLYDRASRIHSRTWIFRTS